MGGKLVRATRHLERAAQFSACRRTPATVPVITKGWGEGLVFLLEVHRWKFTPMADVVEVSLKMKIGKECLL